MVKKKETIMAKKKTSTYKKKPVKTATTKGFAKGKGLRGSTKRRKKT